MNRKRIWLVEDGTGDIPRLAAFIVSRGYIVEVHTLTQELAYSTDFAEDAAPSLIVLNIARSRAAGMSLLAAAREAHPPLPVIVIVAPDQIPAVVEALQAGVSDALVSPVDPQDLVAAIELAWVRRDDAERPSRRFRSPDQPDLDTPGMKQILKVAKTVARTPVPVLILGESGVGKEVLARFIHRQSLRATQPLIKVNCAALPHDLLESELFGYERGAFTGAVGEKPGKFELANKGSIVLDEIGDMPREVQAKLLHVLEDGEVCRLGGKRPVPIDVRVFALTNRKLEEAVPRGEFRDDLYFRLNVIKINIPPLRERKQDIPLLCDWFLLKHQASMESTLKQVPPELVDVFIRYDWPGNIRQLENTIKRYLILPGLDMELNSGSAGKGPSPAAAPPQATTRGETSIPFPAAGESVCLKTIAAAAAEQVEREIVLHVLEQTNWNRRQAARRLNICYKGLLNKLKRWRVS